MGSRLGTEVAATRRASGRGADLFLRIKAAQDIHQTLAEAIQYRGLDRRG